MARDEKLFIKAHKEVWEAEQKVKKANRKFEIAKAWLWMGIGSVLTLLMQWIISFLSQALQLS